MDMRQKRFNNYRHNHISSILFAIQERQKIGLIIFFGSLIFLYKVQKDKQIQQGRG